MAADLDAKIWGVMAASGTGKGLWIKAQLRALKPARLVVWDYKREYQEFAKLAPNLGAVRAAMLKAGAAGPLRIAYCPVGAKDKDVKAEFEALCALVYAWEQCTFIAEELSNVTTPSWAPPAWRKMSTSGRHAGIHLIGVAQMPSLIDKAFLGNCTLIHAGPLNEEAHRDAVERSIDVERGSLADLMKFQWVEKNRDTGEITTGCIVPKGVKAPPIPSVPTRRGRRGAAPLQPAEAGASMGPSTTKHRPRRATP